MKKSPAKLVALASLAIGMTAIADVDVRPIALKGDTAPGTSSGVFTSFSGVLPVINDDGDVAFISTATGDVGGIWFETAGTLNNIRLEGDTAPGTGGLDEFARFEDLIITRSNTVAFSGITKVISSGANANAGYWVDQSGTTSLIIRGGDAAPYIASDATLTGTTSSFGPLSNWFLSYSSGGVAAIEAVCNRPISTDPQGSVILTAALGTLTKIALHGEFIPMSGDKWSGLNSPYISTGGSPLFEFNNDDPMVPPLDIDQEIYFGSPTGVRQQVSVPGGGSGDVFGPMLEDSIVGSPANFAFVGLVNDSGGGSVDFDTGLWRYTGSVGELITGQGQPAPGTGGEDFADLDTGQMSESVHMNADGDVVFRHSTDASTPTQGIWTEPSGGSLTDVALQGQNAPGMSGYTFFSFGKPMIVADGQIAFLAVVENLSVGGVETAIFATNSTGILELVVSTLDMVDINDDCDNPDVQTIKSITLDDGRGTQQGQSNAFNDEGELVLNIEYGTSGEGIFVFDTRACRADFNGDGTLDFNDFTAFQNAFQAEECEADWDGDGDFTIFDFNGFNAAYDAGCEWY